MNTTTMHRRIDVTLPKDTVALIDKVAKKGDRSRLINEAVVHYFEEWGLSNLRKKLKEGAILRAERDLNMTERWFLLDEESWQRGKV